MGQPNKKLRVGSFPRVSFPLFVSLTFESVDEMLCYEHSNETSSVVLPHGTVYLACSCNFWVWMKSYGLSPFKWNSLLVKAVYFLRFAKMHMTFLVTFFFDHSRSNSFNLGNLSNNEWHFELIDWNGSRLIIRNTNCHCFSMTHLLSPFREPGELRQDLNSCPKAQGW